jgi:hypothetical protein
MDDPPERDFSAIHRSGACPAAQLVKTPSGTVVGPSRSGAQPVRPTHSYDIDFIGAQTEWPHADHPADDSFYLWGPEPPADFVTIREAGEKPPA